MSERARYLSQDEAADRLDVSRRTIQRYIAADKLPAYKVGEKLVKLRETDVDAFARRVAVKRRDGCDG